MPQVINVHTHFQPEAALDVVEPYGIELREDEEGNWFFKSGDVVYRIPGVGPEFWGASLDGQIRDMDANGVDVHVLQPSPMVFGYHLDAQVNTLFSRAFNDETARLMAAHPGRFWGSAHVPLQDVELAIGELEHAVNDLGFRSCTAGYVLGADRTIADGSCDAFFARVEQLGVPVLLHPMALGQTLDLTAGGGGWLTNHQVDWAWGYLFVETAAVLGLIFGGVLDRFPGLRFMVPHGGGMIPYQLGRLKMHAERFGRGHTGTGAALDRPVEDYLSAFYFDTVLHDPRSLEFLISMVGAENVVLGTNYPGWDQLAGWDLVRSLPGISQDDKDKILGLNATTRLFSATAGQASLATSSAVSS